MCIASRSLASIFILLLSCQTSPTAFSPSFAPWQDLATEHRYKSIWRINVGCSLGSGVAIGPHRILTAKHVVTCDGKVEQKAQIYSVWQDSWIDATIEKISESHDVAYLRVEIPLTRWMPVSTNEPLIGERLCYMGGNVVLNRVLTKCGEVYTKDLNTEGIKWVYIHAVNGNSGGPLFDKQWRVVGIMIWQDMSAQVIPLELREHSGALVTSPNFP